MWSRKLVDLTGARFGRLYVIGLAPEKRYNKPAWLCRCDCGRVKVIPGNPLLGALKYGHCARDEIETAIKLNDKSALAYLSRGIGNYYLPAAMGGGVDLALKDIDHAIALDPKLGEAYLWKGIVLRKAGKDNEARAALERALQLNPERLWTKQELAKIPVQNSSH